MGEDGRWRIHRHAWALVGAAETFWPGGARRVLAVHRCERCGKERQKPPTGAELKEILTLIEAPRA